MNERGLQAREEAGFVIVAVTGEVDLSWSAELRQEILRSLQAGQSVLVELAAVSYIDSSGIAALVEGYQTARTGAQGFGLLSISEPVRAVLELARLDRVFPIHASVDAARTPAGGGLMAPVDRALRASAPRPDGA